jgi:hypothetical protein
MVYDIPAAIEAGSLSSITPIASNPPPHPGRGSEHLAQPLTLYIARVPGSRDVFLTPLKPREKVVTAQDVQSSLYYVHFNTDADTEALQHQAPSSVNSNAAELQSIQEDSHRRKPVPPPRSPVRTSPSPMGRRPFPSESATEQQNNAPSRVKSQFTRKPLSSVATNTVSSRPSFIDLPELPPSRRKLPTPPGEDEGYGSSLTVNDAYGRNRSLNNYFGDSHDESAAMMPQVGSLTIIRRDPATSTQWNVASVRDPPAEEVSSAALLSPTLYGKVKKGGAPLWLDITNPGYQQYLSSNRSDSRVSTSTSSSENDTAPQGVFRRRLYLPGSRHSDRRWVQKSSQPNALPPNMHDRNSSENSLYPDLTPPLMDRRSAGYSFFSPWDGRCDFSTSTSGRALKCKHHLPNNQGSVEVSELRFNLPTSSKNTATPTSLAEKRGSYFHGLHRRLKSNDSWGGGPSPEGEQELPTYMVDEDGNLDLSLGQEKAGGGFGGKQAKLGKLIVYPDGVAMLDLLVAANVGLWWRAWERV